MTRKLFDIIYALIARQEISKEDAYDALSDYFKVNDILKNEDKETEKLDLNPIVTGPRQILIDQPHYPYLGDSITLTTPEDSVNITGADNSGISIYPQFAVTTASSAASLGGTSNTVCVATDCNCAGITATD